MYYSQFGEDRWLDGHWVELRLPERGRYVDVGASDGVTYSNTRFLEDRGWLGVCFEPDPRCFQKLKINRNCEMHQVAIGDSDEDVDFRIAPSEGCSGIEPSNGVESIIRLPQHRLNSYLVKCPTDILSIDTEGTELDVLAGAQLETLWPLAPRVVIVEYHTWKHPVGPIAKMQSIANRLISIGYRWVHTTEANIIFAG